MTHVVQRRVPAGIPLPSAARENGTPASWATGDATCDVGRAHLSDQREKPALSRSAAWWCDTHSPTRKSRPGFSVAAPDRERPRPGWPRENAASIPRRISRAQFPGGTAEHRRLPKTGSASSEIPGPLSPSPDASVPRHAIPTIASTNAAPNVRRMYINTRTLADLFTWTSQLVCAHNRVSPVSGPAGLNSNLVKNMARPCSTDTIVPVPVPSCTAGGRFKCTYCAE